MTSPELSCSQAPPDGRWRAISSGAPPCTMPCTGSKGTCPRRAGCGRGSLPTSRARHGELFRVCWLLLMGSCQGLHLTAPLAPLAKAYGTALITHPMQTKLVSAAALGVASDWVAQTREPEAYDVWRSTSFLVFSVLYRGLFQHFAFPRIIDLCNGNMLATLLPACAGAIRLLAAIERTLFNQLVVVPIVYYPMFFAITGAVQGLSPSESLQRARKHYLPLMLTTLSFWVPINLYQFFFLPVDWQVPFVCAIGFLWTVILSVLAGRCEKQGCSVEPA